MVLIVITMAVFFTVESEFFKTVESQRAEGYTWQKMDCRQVTEGLPALTIETPTGKNLVCHKLQK